MKEFCFIVEEGKNIQDNYLDYQLVMVQTQHLETLKSPPSKKQGLPSPIPNLQIIDMTLLKKR